MKCVFVLSCLCVLVAVLRLWGASSSELFLSRSPLCDVNIRFSSTTIHINCFFPIVTTWRRFYRLKPLRLGSGPSSVALCLLLLCAGDIEVNPSPRRWRYPCGVCSAPVKCNQRGVQCDTCASWLHARCIGLSNEEYLNLQLSDDPWSCRRCIQDALPFHDISNSDSIFDPSNPDLSHDSIHTHGATQLIQPFPSNHFTVLYANCRGILPKIDHLRLLSTAHNPHIISICETWLDNTISDNELYIPGFSLIRRDREGRGGGIAIFIHDSIIFSIRLMHSSIELLLVDLKFKHQSVTCGLYYRPPSSGVSDLHHLEATLEELPSSCSRSLLL